MIVKPLPKHLRPRYRYLAIGLETWPDADLDQRGFQAAVWAAARGLLGDVGSARMEARVIRFSLEDGDGHAVVRVRRGAVGPARAALACVETVDDEPVGLRIRGVSGTVRACLDRYINRRTEATHEERIAFEGATRRGVVRDGRVDVRTDGAFVGATELDLGARSKSE